MGFVLAYDLVLLPPFVLHFARVKEGHLLRLVTYVVVLSYRSVLAISYCFINKETRL